MSTNDKKSACKALVKELSECVRRFKAREVSSEEAWRELQILTKQLQHLLANTEVNSDAELVAYLRKGELKDFAALQWLMKATQPMTFANALPSPL